MERFRAWGLSAALAVGATGAAVAADPPTQTTLFAKWFGPAKPKAGPVARGSDAGAKPAAAPAPLAADVVAAALRAEQDAFARRMAVCLKLREAAIEKNDDALLRQVDDLERQATATYNARVAALGVPLVKAPLPEASAAAVALDKHLGTGAAVTPLTAPAAPTPAVQTAEARLPAEPAVRTVGDAAPVTSPASPGVRP